MKDDVLAVAELARAAASARLRVLGIEGHESPDGSWQRVTATFIGKTFRGPPFP